MDSCSLFFFFNQMLVKKETEGVTSCVGHSPPKASQGSGLPYLVPGSTLRLAPDLVEIGSTLKPASLSPPLDQDPLETYFCAYPHEVETPC